MQKQLILKISKYSATLGPIGYLPAPGTMGTIVTLPLAYLLSFMPLSLQFVIIMIVCALSYGIIHNALKSFTMTDPSHIILDEVMGTLVTFYGIGWNPIAFLVGFILFRLNDIFKPFGIRYIEKIPGAFGVLLDDLAAGFVAQIFLRLLFL